MTVPKTKLGSTGFQAVQGTGRDARVIALSKEELKNYELRFIFKEYFI